MTLEKSRPNNSMLGIGLAIWFGFLAVLFPFIPIYLGWTSPGIRVSSFVVAGISSAIGLFGAAIELRKLGFFEGSEWENVGFAMGLGALAIAFHFVARSISLNWLAVTIRLVVILLCSLALMFVAVAMGQSIVQQRDKREGGTETAFSRSKALGAAVLFLVTLLTALVNLITGVLEYLRLIGQSGGV